MENKMSFRGTIIIKQKEWLVATCLENNITSQGKTMDEAIALYCEDESK
jgi:predicted RNase H-like HicB family nuclease